MGVRVIRRRVLIGRARTFAGVTAKLRALSRG